MRSSPGAEFEAAWSRRVEAFRMASEGLEKTTGTDRLARQWGYERRTPPDRRGRIPLGR